MRTTKELLELMLENEDLFKYGICEWIRRLWYHNIVSVEEKHQMLQLLSDCFPKMTPFRYLWKEGEIEPRIEWIKEQIQKLSCNDT